MFYLCFCISFVCQIPVKVHAVCGFGLALYTFAVATTRLKNVGQYQCLALYTFAVATTHLKNVGQHQYLALYTFAVATTSLKSIGQYQCLALYTFVVISTRLQKNNLNNEERFNAAPHRAPKLQSV